MKTWLSGMALLWATALPAQSPAPSDAAAWRSDLRFLQRELPARHPGAFAKITRAQWDSAVVSLSARIPRLSANARVIEVFRLVALIGDAHSAVQPTPNLRFRYYPLELYQFDDGLFILRPDSAHQALVGARVLRIGKASAESAMRAKASRSPWRR